MRISALKCWRLGREKNDRMGIFWYFDIWKEKRINGRKIPVYV